MHLISNFNSRIYLGYLLFLKDIYLLDTYSDCYVIVRRFKLQRWIEWFAFLREDVFSWIVGISLSINPNGRIFRMCCLPFSRLSICSLVKLVLFLCSFRFNRSRNCESSSPEELCSELPSEVFSWSRSPPPGYPKTVLLLFINARPHALQPYLPLINKYKGKTFSRLGTVVQKQSLQL